MEQIHRALLARDAGNTVRVLATDSALIAHEIDAISSDASELGITDDVGEGLWLWTGTAKVTNAGYWDQPDEYFTEYTGATSAVLDSSRMGIDAISALFLMSPPEPEIPEDDREDIAPGDDRYYRPA